MSKEVVVSEGNNNSNAFLREVLADFGIETRLAPVAEMSHEIRQRWSNRIGYDAFCLLVSEEDEQRARQVIDHTIFNCKVCLYCVESFVKLGETSCPHCGKAVDPLHPDEIRKQYVADCLEATRQKPK